MGRPPKPTKPALPRLIRIGKTNYPATPMKVIDHYDDGRIKTVQIVHDDVAVSIKEESDRHFVIAYMSEDVLKKQAN